LPNSVLLENSYQLATNDIVADVDDELP
jgi:hypothetical protein